MKLLVFAVSALATVLAQRNPTTICSPEIYETDYYDFNSTAFGFHAVDWTRNRSVVITSSFRVIYLMSSMTGYLISLNGHCTTFPLRPIQIPIHCLPANAIERLNGASRIGPPCEGGIDFLSYDVPIDATSKVRTYFTDTTLVYPILRELIGGGSQISGNVAFFTNPIRTTVPSPLLELPNNCPAVPGSNL